MLGKMEREMDRRFVAASAVLQELNWTIVGEEEAALEDKDLDLPVQLRSNPRVYVRASCSD